MQKLGYIWSTSGSAGTFVVAGAQALPKHYRLPVAPNSPDIGLDIAIYFGQTASPGALIGSTSARPPSGADTSRAVVTFGTSKLTIVAAPRTALAGSLTQRLPWAVAIAGLAMTALVALLVERLTRRELRAETLALQNEKLYDQQRSIAITLQRALLPRDFPAIEGVECAGVYHPGASGTEVGGDWYSVVHSDGDRTYFVVGDISGRGVEAAALMAQLRFTIRTLATLDHDPAEILRRASSDIDFGTTKRFATALIGAVDKEYRLSVATAGHPPPLLVDAQHADYLTLKPGPPLGLGRSGYETKQVSIPPGTTVMTFTDGLVEKRGSSIDDGLQRLRRAAVANSEQAVEGLVNAVIAEIIPSGSEDDVALLALRFGAAKRDLAPSGGAAVRPNAELEATSEAEETDTGDPTGGLDARSGGHV
jgi:serine phosphatase RsbU (regulator of sigma subunit)